MAAALRSLHIASLAAKAFEQRTRSVHNNELNERNSAMAFDYKKEYPELYRPKSAPQLIDVPPIRYLSIRGSGNPNTENGEFQDAISVLYSVSYTLRMSPKAGYDIPGYFEYVVPPLEGFWWTEDGAPIDLAHKEKLQWLAVMRLPDFVRDEDFEWSVAEATKKKRVDCSKANVMTISEGECVQCMHTGSYDSEPATIKQMQSFADGKGYEMDYTATRRHHEIYLSDPRRVAPDKMKTVIRLPVRKAD